MYLGFFNIKDITFMLELDRRHSKFKQSKAKLGYNELGYNNHSVKTKNNSRYRAGRLTVLSISNYLNFGQLSINIVCTVKLGYNE